MPNVALPNTSNGLDGVPPIPIFPSLATNNLPVPLVATAT
jgi:hypothetical protein